MSAAGIAGAGLAWLGASLLVLAEGRRGLAAALAAYSAGLLLCLWTPSAAVLAGGGLAAAGLRIRDGRPGWGLLPAGSTPRIILCAVTGVLAAFTAVSLLAAPGAPAGRFSILVGGLLAGSRALAATRRQASLAAAAAVCLALGAVELELGGMFSSVLLAAVAAALIGLLPAGEAEARGA